MKETRNQLEMRDSWEEDPLDVQEEAGGKVRYPREAALDVAREMVAAVMPHVAVTDGQMRLKVCGSLRRMRAEVGDVEMVFVPRRRLLRAEARDLLGELIAPAVEESEVGRALDDLVERGVLARRLKRDGTCTWGEWNRLAVHVASGIPVDFFGCLEASWWNTVVCRTGGAQTNTAIAQAAIAMGWHWEPSPMASGFRRRKGMGWEHAAVGSEEEVFAFVGMPFLRPEVRR